MQVEYSGRVPRCAAHLFKRNRSCARTSIICRTASVGVFRRSWVAKQWPRLCNTLVFTEDVTGEPLPGIHRAWRLAFKASLMSSHSILLRAYPAIPRLGQEEPRPRAQRILLQEATQIRKPGYLLSLNIKTAELQSFKYQALALLATLHPGHLKDFGAKDLIYEVLRCLARP